jgi:hypothetical protein
VVLSRVVHRCAPRRLAAVVIGLPPSERLSRTLRGAAQRDALIHSGRQRSLGSIRPTIHAKCGRAWGDWPEDSHRPPRPLGPQGRAALPFLGVQVRPARHHEIPDFGSWSGRDHNAPERCASHLTPPTVLAARYLELPDEPVHKHHPG